MQADYVGKDECECNGTNYYEITKTVVFKTGVYAKDKEEAEEIARDFDFDRNHIESEEIEIE